MRGLTLLNSSWTEGARVDIRDVQGNTPLLLSVEGKNQEYSELFLSAGAQVYSINNQELTPVRVALAHDADVVSWFFADNRVNLIDNEGKGPLHHAVIDGGYAG